MWEVYGHRSQSKALERLPVEVLKLHEKWKDVVRLSGLMGLLAIRVFRDEALAGRWKGFLSSRRGQQYRVIYKVEAQDVQVFVMDPTPHEYRSKSMYTKAFRKARRTVEVAVGESVRLMRVLQELSRNQLAEATGISQSTLSAIENGRVPLGVERAKSLAKALMCHPAVFVFTGWEVNRRNAASQLPAADTRKEGPWMIN